jgi:hypothetical protein
MRKNRREIKEKLYRLGKIVGLEASEIEYAKVTIKSKIFTLIIAIIFSLIGLFSSRLDAVGLWYTVVSIKDFGLLSSFF